MLPAAITQPALLNARAGPGLTYDILTTVPQGTWTRITGIDTLGEWYRVELYDLDQPAWIFRDYTKVAGGSLSGLIQIAVGGTPSPTVGQLTSSITVELSLPQVGGVDLDVSWLDASACAQLYSLYHRSSTDSTTYISLEQAATAATVNSKSLSFSTLSGSSFISAWCGTMAAGREIAEVEIDPGVAAPTVRRRPAAGSPQCRRAPTTARAERAVQTELPPAIAMMRVHTKRPPLSTTTAGAFCIGCMHPFRKKARRWRRMFGLPKDLVAPFNIAQEERGRRAQRRPRQSRSTPPGMTDQPYWRPSPPLIFPHISRKPELSRR